MMKKYLGGILCIVTALFSGHAFGQSKIDSPIFTRNVQTIGGTLTVLDLFTAPPANGVFLSGSGAAFGNCPTVGCLAGDHQRSTFYVKATAAQDAGVAEYMATVDSNLNSGKSPQWKIGTAYTAASQVVANGNVYQETVASCTSAAAGGGPVGTGSSIVDNTCLWNFVTTSFAAAKVGFFNSAVTGANASFNSWGMANDLITVAGDTGSFKVGAEFDHQNNALDTSVNGINAHNIFVSGNIGTFPLSADIAIFHPATGSSFASRFGILITGSFEASQATISVQTTQDPIALQIMGTHSSGSFSDTATSPEAINLQGVYSLAAINIGAGTSAININSGNTVCFNGALQCMAFNASPGAVQMPSGSGFPVILTCNGAVLAANTTFFCAQGSNGTENVASSVIPRTGTFRNMQAAQTIAPGAGQTTIYTLRIAAANTAVTCTISGAAATACSDTTHSVNVTAGQKVTIGIANSVTASGTVPQGIGVELN